MQRHTTWPSGLPMLIGALPARRASSAPQLCGRWPTPRELARHAPRAGMRRCEDEVGAAVLTVVVWQSRSAKRDPTQ
eukprot:351375-Chlamydomonas_euryale.AAC.27